MTIHRIALLEPVTVFALIMAYIWQLRYSHHGLWLAILAGMVVSHSGKRRESTQVLGFDRRNLRECLAGVRAAAGVPRVGDAWCGNPVYRLPGPCGSASFPRVGGVCDLGDVPAIPVERVFPEPVHGSDVGRSASVASAVLFSGAHLPNWFLMAVTLIAGYACARIYLRHKNLYFLGIAHATIGFLLFLVVPGFRQPPSGGRSRAGTGNVTSCYSGTDGPTTGHSRDLSPTNLAF